MALLRTAFILALILGLFAGAESRLRRRRRQKQPTKAPVSPSIDKPNGGLLNAVLMEEGDIPVEDDPYPEPEETMIHKALKSSLNRDEAFDRDCEIVAKRFDWPLEDTKKHMTNQRRFAELVTFTRRRFAGIFAGSRFSRKPGSPVGLWFKGKVPERIANVARVFEEETGLKVQVNGDMRFSLRDQDRRLDIISSLLRKQGYDDVGGAVLVGDIIHVTLEADSRFPPTKEIESPSPKYSQKVAKKLLPGFDAYGVHITFSESPVNVDEHAYGGRMVYADDTDGDGKVAVCTSAFSVYRVSDNRNGIATAAHCTGMVNFDAVSPESDFDLFHKDEHRGDYGDMEWKTSNHFEIAEYYAEPGTTRRDVTSVTNSFSENDVVCVYSRMQSERTCEYVYSVNVNQGGDKKLIAVDSHVTTGGDSGGPWSWGSEAAGVHKGYKTIWFKKRSTFSKAKLLNSALGVKVLLK